MTTKGEDQEYIKDSKQKDIFEQTLQQAGNCRVQKYSKESEIKE